MMKDPVPRIALFAPTQVEFTDPNRALLASYRMDEGSLAVATGKLHGTEVVLVRSGMGGPNTSRAAQRTLDRFTITQVVLVGFAGGAKAGLGTGDLVVCSEAIEYGEAGRRTHSTPELVERARRTGQPATTSAALTVTRVISTADEKRRLGEEYDAAVVEMEGFHLLNVFGLCGVPGLMVRAVLDPVDEDLPDMSHLLKDTGEPRPGALLAYLSSNPAQALKLPGLKKRVKVCRQAMNRFVKEYLSF
jgi:adenosylhomocysteine nucleosidase